MAANIGNSSDSVTHWVDRANEMFESRASGIKSERKYFFQNPAKTGRIALSTDKPVGFEKMTRKEVYKFFLEKTRGAENDPSVKLLIRKFEEWKSSKMANIVKTISTLVPFRKGGVSISPELEASSSSSLDSEANSTRLEIETERKKLIGIIQFALSGLVAIERSRSGVQGVYYLSTDDDTIEVPALKLSHEPFKQVLADRIYVKMGFQTPGYAFISKESPDSGELTEQAFNALEARGIPVLEEKIEKGDGFVESLKIHLAQLKIQLTTVKSLLIMNFVKGVPFEDLNKDELKQILVNPKVIKDIGEMIFIDISINNTDRIHPTALTCNLGNLLLQNPEATEGEKSIAVIDHDFRVGEIESVFENLEMLIEGKHTAQILQNLTYGLQPIFKDAGETNAFIFGTNRNLIEENLQKGFNEGLQKFSHVFKNPKMVHALLEGHEKEIEFFLNVLSFTQENLMSKVKSE